MTDKDKEEVKQLEEQLKTKIAELKSKQLVLPDARADGKPLSTIKNAETLIQHYGISIRHNEMTKDEEIDFPNERFHPDTKANAAFGKLIDHFRQNHMPIVDLQSYVSLIANKNAYHPVRDWIDSITWDGISRLNDYYAIVNSSQPMKETIMRKWALSAVAALYHTNFSCEGVLVLVGAQGIGKTTLIFRLLPSELAASCIKDAVTQSVDNKDSVLKAVSSWITELGELPSTFKKSDREALKGFITEKADKIRPAYARKADTYGRRTVFYATVNDHKFLQDDENRRFWVLDIERINMINFDIGQFWAEMKQIYLSIRDKIATPELRDQNQEWGWFLSPSERAQLEVAVDDHKTSDPIDEILENRVVLNGTNAEWMNCTAILKACGKLEPNKADLNRAGVWLKKNGIKYGNSKRWFIEVKTSDAVFSTQKPKNLRLLSPEKD